MDSLIQTCDPNIWIIEQAKGYVKYCEILDGEKVKIWEVTGYCTGIGNCWEGAVNPKPELDCPVNENFKNNCCPLMVTVLWKK